MKPTDELIEEHRIILHVLDGIERDVETIRKTGKIDPDKIAKLIDFLVNFVDRCHHTKEEDYVIAKLIVGSPSFSGFLASILLEHMQGREQVRTISEALPAASKSDPTAVRTIADTLTDYVVMLHGHIKKENLTLFPKADEVLSEKDQREIEEGFEKVEHAVIGEGVHEKYHRLAEELM
jgi:hemerythrin-like domain-containing protein